MASSLTAILLLIRRYVTEYSIWALAGGEIIVSSDPRNMSDLQKKLWLNEEVIAMYQVCVFVVVVGRGGEMIGFY